MTQDDYVRPTDYIKKDIPLRIVYGTGIGLNDNIAAIAALTDSGLKEKPKGAIYAIQPDPMGGFSATLGIERKRR